MPAILTRGAERPCWQVQKLRPSQVQGWHSTLLQRGGKAGKPLSPRTVGDMPTASCIGPWSAGKAETISRNVAHVIDPPKVEGREIEALTTGQMGDVLAKLRGHVLFPIVAVALATGMRRGEILALRWTDLNLDRPEPR
jgi:hypothetical protein